VVDTQSKPRLRGWSHAAGAVLAVAGTIVLVSLTGTQPAKAATMVLYGGSLTLLLGVSALYHIVYWRARAPPTPLRGNRGFPLRNRKIGW